jgi:hypothetical protein
MKQISFASMAWQNKGKVTRREAVFGRDGRGDPLGKIAEADRAALPEGG